MASFHYSDIYINDAFSIAGPLERDGQIRKFDLTLDDYYYTEKTFERAEIKMQQEAISGLLQRNRLLEGEIDLLVSGDLSNQMAISSYAAKDYKIPLLGLYSACATFTESLIVASNSLMSGNLKKVMTVTSSHNLNAEKQFRFPIEYGAPKPHRSTFTTTGSVSTLISKVPSSVKIESATVGKPIDMGITDAFHMGAVMAPAAASVLMEHLTENNRDVSYYDLILTGDLGKVGSEIFTEFLKRNYNIRLKKHIDAGMEIYTDSQETYAGGSGPVAMPLVLFNKILKNKKYRKILVIATGSLHSPVMVNQKMSIPGIAHAVSLEVRS